MTKSNKKMIGISALGVFAYLIVPKTGEPGLVVLITFLGFAVFLLWEALEWLERIAAILGCNPGMDQQIEKLNAQPVSKLTDAQVEELEQTIDRLSRENSLAKPARMGQVERIIELLHRMLQLLEARTA